MYLGLLCLFPYLCGNSGDMEWHGYMVCVFHSVTGCISFQCFCCKSQWTTKFKNKKVTTTILQKATILQKNNNILVVKFSRIALLVVVFLSVKQSWENWFNSHSIKDHYFKWNRWKQPPPVQSYSNFHQRKHQCIYIFLDFFPFTCILMITSECNFYK